MQQEFRIWLEEKEINETLFALNPELKQSIHNWSSRPFKFANFIKECSKRFNLFKILPDAIASVRQDQELMNIVRNKNFIESGRKPPHSVGMFDL